MDTKFRTVLLFGPPGSGKGTHGRVIGNIPRFYYFACGDAFRSLKPEDPTGRIFIDYAGRGLLVPNEIAIGLWSRRIQGAIQKGDYMPERDILVLDGIPRNLAQAQMMSDKMNVEAMFYLHCADTQVLVQRLQRRATIEGRIDDARLEVIHKRLETYEKETRPVLNFYGAKTCHSIECNRPPVRVLADIINALASLS